jgi:hypothetical protein
MKISYLLLVSNILIKSRRERHDTDKTGGHQNRTLTINNRTFYIVQYRTHLFYC